MRFRDQGSGSPSRFGSGVCDVGFGLYGTAFRVRVCVTFWDGVEGVGCRVQGAGCRVQGVGSRV